MGVVAGGRGPRGLVEARAAYVELVSQGVGTVQACRLVGVDRKTGYRWRYGSRPRSRRGRVRPVVVPPVVSARFLSVDERVLIADLRREGLSVRAVAAELGRAPSTISREIRRNADGMGRYMPYTAQGKAQARRPRPKSGKLETHARLREYVVGGLDRRWSPQQISVMVRRDFPTDEGMRVSPETIYQALYVQGRGGLRRELAKALRTGRTQRKPHRRGNARRPRFAPPMLMIADRPAEAGDRAVPGHWEGDLIIGAGGTSAIGTLVERATRYVMLVHLPGGVHTAEAVTTALIDTVTGLPAHLKRSLAWDQGSEMGGHLDFTCATGMPVYFCDPGSPWQRGSNENTNGLLRQYFPKGTDLTVHSKADLNAVATELNQRPRKTLDWDTPARRLATLLTNKLTDVLRPPRETTPRTGGRTTHKVCTI